MVPTGRCEGGGPESLLDAMVFYWGVNFWRLTNEFLEAIKFLAAGFQSPKRFNYRAKKPHWVISDVNMGIVYLYELKMRHSFWPCEILTPIHPRSDKLSCNINIFLVVSQTATPWHGVSISNCTQQETPGVLSRNWLAIRLVAKHTAILQFRYFRSYLSSLTNCIGRMGSPEHRDTCV